MNEMSTVNEYSDEYSDEYLYQKHISESTGQAENSYAVIRSNKNKQIIISTVIRTVANNSSITVKSQDVKTLQVSNEL